MDDPSAREFLRAVFDSAGIGLCLVGADDRVIMANTEWLRAAGLVNQEVVGKRILDWIPDAGKRDLAAALCARARAGETVQVPYHRRRVADGDRWWEGTASPAPLTEGVGLVVTAHDFTERRRAEEEAAQALEKFRRATEATIHAIALSVEARDPYTAGHQRRVARIAFRVAEAMGLSSETTEAIRIAASVHDLGKIGVPAEILSKPGRISQAEFSVIRAHPQLGHDILAAVDLPWPVARITLQHHERMDGSGYPSGLSGEQICLEARILAVVDVIEAMLSHRPYRPALGMDKVLQELLRNKGVAYDSEVVDATLGLFASFGDLFADQ